MIDAGTNRLLTEIKVGPRPRDTAFSSDSTRAYVTSENGASVTVIDTASMAPIDTITLTGENVRPMGAVMAPDDRRL